MRRDPYFWCFWPIGAIAGYFAANDVSVWKGGTTTPQNKKPAMCLLGLVLFEEKYIVAAVSTSTAVVSRDASIWRVAAQF